MLRTRFWPITARPIRPISQFEFAMGVSGTLSFLHSSQESARAPALGAPSVVPSRGSFNTCRFAIPRIHASPLLVPGRPLGGSRPHKALSLHGYSVAPRRVYRPERHSRAGTETT